MCKQWRLAEKQKRTEYAELRYVIVTDVPIQCHMSCIRADCGGNLSSLEWHGLTGYSFVEYSVFTSRTEIDMKVMDCAIVHHSRPVNVTRVTRPLLCVRLMPLVKILFFCCQINYIVFFPLNWMFCLCFLSTSSKDT